MTGQLRGWDAEFCPDPAPTVISGVPQQYAGFYLGGSSAAHVWNPAERALLARSGLLAEPIWVPTPGFDNPRQVALQAAAALAEAGIPAHATPWRVLMWDLETGIEPDPMWLSAAADTLASRGYGSLVYGSQLGSGLFAYSPRSGYVLARWDGVAQVPAQSDIIAKQYAAGVDVPGGQVDLDVARQQLGAHLGHLA